MTWTDADREKAAEMLRSGMSARRMGAAFKMTRNAIIGRVTRDKDLKAIGLNGIVGNQTIKPKTPRGPNPANLVGKKAARPHDPPVPKFAPTVFECRAVPLVDLAPRECRWAVNNAAAGEQHLFCGNPTGVGDAYCKPHLARSSRQY